MKEIWQNPDRIIILMYIVYNVLKKSLDYFKTDSNNANEQQSKLINIIADKISKQSDSIHELAVAITRNNENNNINNQNQKDDLKNIKENITNISSKTDRILNLIDDIKNNRCNKGG